MSDTVYCTGSLELTPIADNDANQLACHLYLQPWYSDKWRLSIKDGHVLLSCYWAPVDHDAIMNLASNKDVESKTVDGILDMVDVISRTGETVMITGDHVIVRPSNPKIILAAIRARELGWQTVMDAEYRAHEETMGSLVRLLPTVKTRKAITTRAESHVEPARAIAY